MCSCELTLIVIESDRGQHNTSLMRSRSRSFSPDSSDFGNSPIKITRGRSPSPSNSPVRSPARNPSSYLAVGNLTRNVNENHLKEIFGVYGEIVTVSYPMHPNTGYPIGKAVIHFKEMVSVENAIKGMNGGQIDGNVIECEISKYSEPILKFNRGTREPRHHGNRAARHGRMDHYAPAGRRNHTRTPERRSRSPIRRRSSPSRSPMRPGRRVSPRRYSRSGSPTRRVSRSPRRLSRSPSRRFSRSPRRYSRSPRRYSRSPVRRVSRSPSRFSRSRSPVRRYSRSPIRRSPSPHYRRGSFSRSPDRRRSRSFSRSPPRRRSPSYSRSRSPPRHRNDGPLRRIDRSPKRFSPRRSPSRSPIPVSRMNY